LAGIVGAIFFTIPFPILGTIFGVCFGCFLGAIVGEVWGGTEVGDSLRVGLGAAEGRLLGIVTKLLFGCTILIVVAVTAFPYELTWSRQGLKPAPASAPVAPGAARGVR